ncbi:hypothetical protein TRVL_01878 [Trypanosoma vivax]|nr:hypothetical protein TRVL_01878 [Trypanosoma vivax]
MFLERDDLTKYGEQERTFYEEYQKQGVFVVDGFAEQARMLAHKQEMLRNEEDRRVRQQATTLLKLIDDIIRSRSELDPTVRYALEAMGLSPAPLKPTADDVESERHQPQAHYLHPWEEETDDENNPVSEQSEPKRKIPRKDAKRERAYLILDDSDTEPIVDVIEDDILS